MVLSNTHAMIFLNAFPTTLDFSPPKKSDTSKTLFRHYQEMHVWIRKHPPETPMPKVFLARWFQKTPEQLESLKGNFESEVKAFSFKPPYEALRKREKIEGSRKRIKKNHGMGV